MKPNRRFFDSISFKSWLYFMLFALSILLLLLFFETILLEPAYTRTLKNQIVRYNHDIYSISISDNSEEEKESMMYNLTSQNNGCMLVYNKDTGTTEKAYNMLGESGCAIYSESAVNPDIIEQLDRSESYSIYLKGDYQTLDGQEVMIYGEKNVINSVRYYIITNFALQPMNAIIKTTQNQFLVIAIVSMILALIISFLFSRYLTKPIVRIQDEANKLAVGNYDLHFEKSDFKEIDDLADTLSIAATELSNIDEIRKELVANVSHDLKTPLTMIKAYAEMIKDISGDTKKKRDEHLDIILDETDKLDKLVTDMLDLSKLQAGVIELDIKPFDLTQNVFNAVSRFNTIAKNEGVEVIVECEPELLVYGDESKINEVLYNFISNALKHYGDDKQIIIRAYLLDKNTARVEVTDHGPGISEDILPYIWDRYFKSDKKYKRAQSGSGLGLAINKAILEEHDSRYGVDTEVGKGSTFYFDLRLVNEEDEGQA